MGLFFCKCAPGNSDSKATADNSNEQQSSVIRKITTDKDFREVLTSADDKNVVVDFFATWCGPCKKAAPMYKNFDFLKELAEKYKEQCIAITVDVDQLQEIAAESGITAMPTFHLYKRGVKVDEVIGAPRKEQLEKLFTQ